jgi:hypothetical protein|tara:strand:+ start:481 stop:684 length:204 start_codon:yes stop_codon:yes gene_type:complete
MLNKNLMEYQLSSDGSRMLADIEDIRKLIMDTVRLSQSHNEICRCLEALTGHRVDSSDEENKKWISK